MPFQKQLGAKETILDDAKSKDGHQFYQLSQKLVFVWCIGPAFEAEVSLDWNLA